MRTRKSNRTKRFTVEKFDFEGSSAEEDTQPPLSRRQREADDRDANFDDEAAARGDDIDSHAGSDDDVAAAIPTSDSEASEALAASPSRRRGRGEPTPRRARPLRPFHTTNSSKTTAYLDIEPIISDSHLPRGYAGSFERHIRGTTLANVWYGPDPRNVDTALRLLDRWLAWPLLPPSEPVKDSSACSPRGIWDRRVFEREAAYAEKWRARLQADESQGTILYPLSEDESRPYRLQPGTLPVLMGPHDAQGGFQFAAGESCLLSYTGLPFDPGNDESQVPSGWMFDAGGIVLSLDWAQRQGLDTPQLLALAAIPHGDQEEYDYEKEAARPDFQKYGTVQIWEFWGQKRDNASMRPAAAKPKLLKTLCLACGRSRRVAWSPALDHLAILSGDGTVCVLEPLSGGDTPYEKVQRPLAYFSLEDDVKATAMAWVNFNRLAVGYSDGSIALWSIYPNCLLSRHPIHHSGIIGMASGYPTMPYLIASVPIGGFYKLTDLRSPSYETTEVPSLAITTAPGLISWSDHLKGFFALAPSSNVLNTTVGFMHHAHFPIIRRAYACDSFVTSLAVGRTHPFILVGAADGSLGALNSQFEVMQLLKGRRQATDRVRIFQHEHHPQDNFDGAGPPGARRGASRILHGFKPEKNSHSKAEAARKPKPKKKTKKKAEDGDEDEDVEQDETSGPVDPSRGILYEPLTRITAVEWNPNEGYGCWAAAAMGSGLVKVMDLGLDMPDTT